MSPDSSERGPDHNLDELSRAAAIKLAQTEWHLEAESELEIEPEVELELPSNAPLIPVLTRESAEIGNVGFPDKERVAETPPDPDSILEALLFVGGSPLTAESAAAALRGFDAERFHDTVGRLNKKYRDQNRPYSIQPKEGGFTLVLKPAYRGLREKLHGGPREARLSQAALDVLSLITYRQPIAKSELDSLRGADSAPILRQLVRVGLIAISKRGEAGRKEQCYGTTLRFLELFGLSGLDDLPRLADASS